MDIYADTKQKYLEVECDQNLFLSTFGEEAHALFGKVPHHVRLMWRREFIYDIYEELKTVDDITEKLISVLPNIDKLPEEREKNRVIDKLIHVLETRIRNGQPFSVNVSLLKRFVKVKHRRLKKLYKQLPKMQDNSTIT